MTACRGCGLVQLTHNPPIDLISPRLPWIRYNEPGAHLDGVSARLGALLPDRPCIALGVGPFDLPLLERLNHVGLSYEVLESPVGARRNTRTDRYPYLETIQAGLNDLLPSEGPSGLADLVSCRYLLEHCHDPVGALDGLRKLLAPLGLLVIEVPDSSAFLMRNDYSFVWEEHVSYFTEATLRLMVRRAGGQIVDFIRSPGALEDSLLVVLRFAAEEFSLPVTDAESIALFEGYLGGFSTVRRAWRGRLETWTGAGDRVAIFGAGHQAIMFVNALRIGGSIDAMIDDAPEKQGLFPPGLLSAIRSSSDWLSDPANTICLLAVSPAGEAAVLRKCAPLLNRGGRIYSIFRGPDHGPLSIETT